MALPDRKYLTHKPQEYRNLSKAGQLRVDSLPESQKLYQTKHDGCSIIIMVGINVVRIFSREGKECVSMPHIAEHFRVNSIPNMVYFGEVWNATMEFKDISGMFRRQSPQPELEAWLFDAVTLQEFRAGSSARPYCQRWKALQHVLDRTAGVMPVLSGYDKLELQGKAQALRDQGLLFRLDGLIQRDIEGGWKAGVDNDGLVLKLKDVISVDLKCVGVVEGEGKFKGMVGALEVLWRGERVQVSGGKLTTQERKDFWYLAQIGSLFECDLLTDKRIDTILGKIVEVHALSITPDGKLREPRYQRIRDDKTEASE